MRAASEARLRLCSSICMLRCCSSRSLSITSPLRTCHTQPRSVSICTAVLVKQVKCASAPTTHSSSGVSICTTFVLVKRK